MKNHIPQTLLILLAVCTTSFLVLTSNFANRIAADEPVEQLNSTRGLSVFTYQDPARLGFFNAETGDIYVYHEGKLLSHSKMHDAGKDLEKIKFGMIIRENGKVSRVVYPDGRESAPAPTPTVEPNDKLKADADKEDPSPSNDGKDK